MRLTCQHVDPLCLSEAGVATGVLRLPLLVSSLRLTQLG
jgi:hypothetical protein